MALTTTEVFVIPISDRNLICYDITGDASATTWTAPCGTIDAAWVQCETAADQDIGITFATNVVTFTEAIAAASVYKVFVIGTA